MVGYFVTTIYTSIFNTIIDMVIGFRQRYVTVCECDANGAEQFLIPIGVESNITSEQEYTVQFRVLQTITPGSQRASVGPDQSSITDFDVIFGNEENNVIRDLRTLRAGNKQFLESFFAAITNDFVSEEFECFTMRIGTTDTGGVRRVYFYCTSDSDPGDDFFCQTTICIVDDDGKDSLINSSFGANNILFKISEPFVVGYVETAYTVNESVGAVSVCVNLIQPVTDIFDEFVIVRVTDYPSVNLTCSSTLASGLSYKH